MYFNSGEESPRVDPESVKHVGNVFCAAFITRVKGSGGELFFY